MDKFADRRLTNAHSGSDAPTICAGCQLEVSDPHEPLHRFGCPRCGGGLVQLPVPEESGFEQPLPAPLRTRR